MPRRFVSLCLLLLCQGAHASTTSPDAPAQLILTTENAAPIQSKAIYVPGSLRLGHEGGSAPLEVRTHGNSTIGFPKLSYKFRLGEERSLLGLPSAREWVLLANYSDKTLMRNFIALELSRSLNPRYAPRSRFVELTLNGDYLGVYQLVEQVEVHPSRLNIRKLGKNDLREDELDGGFLLEITAGPQEKVFFRTPRGIIFNLKSPKNPQPAQLRSIEEYVRATENALFSPEFEDEQRGYSRYLDAEQFLLWYLVNELFRNQDSALYASIYVHKDRGGRLAMGPVWDFDIGAGNVNYDDNFLTDGWWVQKRSLWFARLFESERFQARTRQLWRGIRSVQIEKMFLAIDASARFLERAQGRNFSRWPILDKHVWPNHVVTGSYAGEVAYLKDWLRKRVAWLDSQWLR